ncbi:hypothetical protein EP56_08460 [Listeriaceae bacterium FSL A5-0209]|nr:hypothetical protein EP56_08460 [Listeriaceae bacterium FSL A5-0209]
MISEVMEEAEVKICNIVREKLHNKKASFSDIQKLLDEIADFVGDDSGLNTKWVLDQQSFQKSETTFYAAGYDICTYCIKYDLEQNLFIATEVL